MKKETMIKILVAMDVKFSRSWNKIKLQNEINTNAHEMNENRNLLKSFDDWGSHFDLSNI